jgi:hypothetical protein
MLSAWAIEEAAIEMSFGQANLECEKKKQNPKIGINRPSDLLY